MIDIQEELRKLRPIDLSVDDPANAAVGAEDVPGSIARALGRLGKQQLRATQQADVALEELRNALTAAQTAQATLRDQADDYRRQVQRLKEDAVASRLAALQVIDTLDDLAVIARQKNDDTWLSRVDRLTSRTLDALGSMGMSEIAVGETFDETRHEVVGTVEGGERDAFVITELVRRGFWFDSRVLRRAQVIITR